MIKVMKKAEKALKGVEVGVRVVRTVVSIAYSCVSAVLIFQKLLEML